MKYAIGIFISVTVDDLHEQIATLTPTVGSETGGRIEIDANHRLVGEGIRASGIRNCHVVRRPSLQRECRKITILPGASWTSRRVSRISGQCSAEALGTREGFVAQRRTILQCCKIGPVGRGIHNRRGRFVHVPQMQRIGVRCVRARYFRLADNCRQSHTSHDGEEVWRPGFSRFHLFVVAP